MHPAPTNLAGLPGRRRELNHGADLEHVPAFLSPPERFVLWEESQRYRWEHQAVRSVQTLRANAGFAEDSKTVNTRTERHLSYQRKKTTGQSKLDAS